MTGHRPASLALIIPTCNRPESLKRCMASIEAEATRPAVVLVADSSDGDETRRIVEGWSGPSGTVYQYVPCPTRGVTAQRNRAIALIPPGIDYVGFSDDDIVFGVDYHSRLLELLESAGAQVIGAAGATAAVESVVEESRVRRRILRTFMLSGESKGQLLPSGINIRPPDQGPPIGVDWLFGCAVYRAAAVTATPFSEKLRGYGQYEDVDYSLRMRRLGRLIVDPEARLVHAHGAQGRMPTRDLARWAIKNRYWLVCEHPDMGLSMSWFWWSVFGVLLVTAVSSAARDGSHARAHLAGTIVGVGDILRGISDGVLS